MELILYQKSEVVLDQGSHVEEGGAGEGPLGRYFGSERLQM